MNLDNLFNPKSIAVIGASAENGKIGNVIAKNILSLGYKGEIFLVNPKKGNILNQKCYGDVLEIKKKVDLAILAIPAEFVNETVKKASSVVKNFVVISAGFSEIGSEGKKREIELKKIIEKNNLNILGPNCLGFINPKINLNASFAGEMPQRGNICFISQSGALAVAFMDIAQKEDMGFSGIVSIGNKIQIDENNLLEYFGKDKNTKVIGLYLEDIKNGQDFIAKAREISKIKPIVLLKSGKTEKSQMAVASHTGALAGSNEIMQAAFEKTGIIAADNLEEFFKLLEFFSLARFFKEEQVVILTNAGGAGVLATDAFDKKEIKLAEIDKKIKTKLEKFLPLESSLQNPIDLLGDAQEDRYEKALNEVGQQKNIGMIVSILTPQKQTPVDEIAKRLVNFAKKHKNFQLVASFIGGNKIKNAVTFLKKNNIPNFSFPEQAIETLEKYSKWKKWKECAPEREEKFLRNEGRAKAVGNIIEKARQENRTALLFSEASEIMKKYDINTVKFWTTDSKEKISFPVVVKVDSDKVLHKTDKKGLVLGINNKKELAESIRKMQKSFPKKDIIFQPMLPRQMELIVGIKRDSVFGPVVVYGLGGIYTEVLNAVNFLVLPKSKNEIKKALNKSRISFLFKKTRGQDSFSVENVARILWNVWMLANEVDEIKELDINPLLVYNDEKRDTAVDVKIII